jgi:protein TonB
MPARGAAAALLFAAICVMSSAQAATRTPPHIDTSGVNLQPAYPSSALAANERGAAMIDVEVTADGKVDRVALRQTSGFNDLDAAAIAGVMGWRFIPATEGGKNVAGVTTVALGFQAPGEQDASTAPPKPAGDFLTPSFELTAPQDEYQERKKPIPCAIGEIDATLELERPHLSATGKYYASASVGVEDAHHAVRLYMEGPFVEHFWVGTDFDDTQTSGPAFALHDMNGARYEPSHFQTSGLSFSGGWTAPAPVPVSISWNGHGLIKATVNAMESHEIQALWPPSEIVFVGASGQAKFTNAKLLCFPGSSAEAGPHGSTSSP